LNEDRGHAVGPRSRSGPDREDGASSPAPRTWRDSWRHSGLDPDDDDDWKQIVRINRRAVDAEVRSEKIEVGRTRILVSTLSAAAGAMIALAVGVIPGVWKWLLSHSQ
jgi:hypothetical protein